MIDISRPAQVGDIVRFTYLESLMPKSGWGRVEVATSHGARIAVFKEDCKERAGFSLDVRLSDCRVQVDPYDMLRWCKRQFALIAAQDQGCGGNVSLPVAWQRAQALANEAIRALGAVSTECGEEVKP